MRQSISIMKRSNDTFRDIQTIDFLKNGFNTFIKESWIHIIHISRWFLSQVTFPASLRYFTGYYASVSKGEILRVNNEDYAFRGRIEAIDILSDILLEKDESLRDASAHPDVGVGPLFLLQGSSPSLPVSFARDYHPLGTYATRSPVRTYPRFRSGVLLRETWRYPRTWVISARHSTSRVAPRVHDRRHFRLSRLNKPPSVVFHRRSEIHTWIYLKELVASEIFQINYNNNTNKYNKVHFIFQ